jgi:hypothetical protein
LKRRAEEKAAGASFFLGAGKNEIEEQPDKREKKRKRLSAGGSKIAVTAIPRG